MRRTMKHIITERQENYLKRWNKFQTFMLRRDTEIKQLISKLSRRPLTNIAMIMDTVLANLSNELHIDEDDERFDWIYHYLKDNYSDYVNKQLEK